MDKRGPAKRLDRKDHFTITVISTHGEPMEAIEDLPEDMQCHVVGMPRDWVRTFRHVANAIATYLAAHLEPGH